MNPKCKATDFFMRIFVFLALIAAATGCDGTSPEAGLGYSTTAQEASQSPSLLQKHTKIIRS